MDPQQQQVDHHSGDQHPATDSQIQIESFSSFAVNQVQKFNILLAAHLKPTDLIVTISNQILGLIDKQLDWIDAHGSAQKVCRVSFRAPMVGVYTVDVELANRVDRGQFQAKAYDLSKVFIHGSSGRCRVNQSYEFSVDASEAGEGQLEIAVNEGEIPNQVQVLDNGKCIVSFVPEDNVPHIVDIKFNGHNVNGCPFVVEIQNDEDNLSEKNDRKVVEHDAITNNKSITSQQQVIPATITLPPNLIKEERVLVNSLASFILENLGPLDRALDSNDLLILDPENQQINYKILVIEEASNKQATTTSHKFEFKPTIVGDYTVDLTQKSQLLYKLPTTILDQFPFPLKVFDFNKVIVSDVTDGVIGHPIYFFIDASQAGSGNLEIRVSSKTRNVPNYPQSEANAKIRVNFTPTEAVDHSIDVKFNGIPAPGNPFLVKVAQYPQARLPITSQDLLKYVAIDEFVNFHVDYIGSKENKNLPLHELTDKSCQVHVLRPDFVYAKLSTIQLKLDKDEAKQSARFRVSFKPTKIGPYKLFITVNNELLPNSPIISNAYNINEVKVHFSENQANSSKPVAQLDQPTTFTVDASRAGEGTLALAVVSGLTRSLVQTEVKVSEKGHGLYNLTFVPTEFAAHSIDMSFNERVVPKSPFIVEILDAQGKSSEGAKSVATSSSGFASDTERAQQQQMVQNFEALNLGSAKKSPLKASKSQQKSSVPTTTNKKSLAYGLVNASNIVYLETGVLDSGKSQVNLVGPNGEKVAFKLGKGAPQPGESKKPFIEYRPKSIGTHTISVLEGGSKDLRQYFVEICDPSLIKITNFNRSDKFSVGRAVTLRLDSRDAGEIQLDSITILGPSTSNGNDTKQRLNGKSRDGGGSEQQQTILGRIKSISSPSSSSSTSAQSSGLQSQQPIEYSISQLDDHTREIRFTPSLAGKHSIDIRCLGQSVAQSPIEIEVVKATATPATGSSAVDPRQQLYSPVAAAATATNTTLSNNNSNNSSSNHKTNGHHKAAAATMLSKEEELLQNIVVHGISLKCSPVNSTGAFIIETNRQAQARDFDVLITDPSNSLVDVQCYLQQDGNLLAEWTPRRVGTHKIEVFYKDRQVPGSPFVTESFDPSGVIIENVKTTIYSINDRIEFKINRKEAGYGELDVAITSPVGQDLPIEVIPLNEESGEIGELISFTPTVAGKYKMSITFGGYEVPKSPITFTAKGELAVSAATAQQPNLAANATTNRQVKVSGNGIKSAEVNRSAQFLVESVVDGELKLRIECGDREIVPKIEKRSIGNNSSAVSYVVKYKPTEVGYTIISLYWNGVSLDGSPYSVPTNDLSRILFLSGTNKSSNGTSNQRIIVDYVPKVVKEITLDTSNCGPGELMAEAYCRANPNIKYSVPVSQYVASRYKLLFCCPPQKQEQLAKGLSLKDIPLEATYLIRFYYNNLSVPETLASVVVSPTSASHHQNGNGQLNHRKTSLVDSSTLAENNNNDSIKTKAAAINGRNLLDNGDSSAVVALRGHGLVDARCDEEAEFTIDGSEAGPGMPEVRFTRISSASDAAEDCIIKVRLDELDSRHYKASYTPRVAGVYSLNVLWDGKQVAGCPITVNVAGHCDPNKVLCTGDGLKGGVLGEEIKVFIDTRRAGPGELTALCSGPQKVAFCELLDRGDGTFILYIKPQEAGRQSLTIKYGGQHIPQSPFMIKVSGKPDPSRVRVYGPGVEHGVLSLYQSRFVCDTRGAGAGQLTVRIRGPKGAFRMETQRESQRDRTILCKYDPTEPGDYRIEIKWSGRHVPGSPFSVMIFDTQEELYRFLMLMK